jgi:hypothetical protein
VTGDDACAVCEHGVRPPELDDARRDRGDLRRVMRARVARVGHELSDRAEVDSGLHARSVQQSEAAR